MPAFRYTAIDPSGKQVTGTLEAASEAAVADRLQRSGLMLLRASSGFGGWRRMLEADLFGARSLTRDEVAEMTRELAVMQGAGQDLDQSLRFLVETATSARARAVLEDLRDRVRGGAPLATALGQHPAAFSRLYVGLVKAGETAGKLTDTLTYLATLLERQRALAATISSAMIYPALLSIAAIGAIALLLVFVLPQFAQIFNDAGAKLPTSTRVLLGLGDGVRDFGPLLLAVALGLGMLVRQMLKLPANRAIADRRLLGVPVVGGLIQQAEAARFTRTLGTLLANGVGLVPSLGITRDVMGNRTAADAIERAIARIKEGGTLGAALADSPAFPRRTIHLLRLGGETGHLAEMALRAAEIHEEILRRQVQRLVALLVPVITIVMGIAVAAIIGSLLVAMLSLNDLAI